MMISRIEENLRKVINKKEDIILENKSVCFFTNGKFKFNEIEEIIKKGIKNRK